MSKKLSWFAIGVFLCVILFLNWCYQYLEFSANMLIALDGSTVSEDVVNGVFERFCVGK